MKIRIWPDGTWQSTEDTPYSWLSDDYEVHFVPDDTDPDDYVKDYAMQVITELGLFPIITKNNREVFRTDSLDLTIEQRKH